MAKHLQEIRADHSVKDIRTKHLHAMDMEHEHEFIKQLRQHAGVGGELRTTRHKNGNPIETNAHNAAGTHVGTWNHKTAAGFLKFGEEVEMLGESDELNEDPNRRQHFHEKAYWHHMDKHIHHYTHEHGDFEQGDMHARAAEHHAAEHYKQSGNKIIDPGYTGPSPHVSGSR